MTQQILTVIGLGVMADDWQWKIGEYIALDAQTPFQITDSRLICNPFGNCFRQLVAGGFQGTQGAFEAAGWRRVDPPKEPTP